MSRKNFSAFTRMHRVSATTGVILGLAISAGAQDVPRITTTVKDSALVTLKGNTLPVATSLNDRGRLPDDTPTGRVLMVLKHSDDQQASLDTLISAQATKNSAEYHKWITPSQYATQFGVADADIQQVTAYLSNHGFNVAQVYPNKMAIEFSGTAGQMRSTFKTELHTFSVNGQTFTANDRDPQIPAALASVITGFASLNNYHPATKLPAAPMGETAQLKHTTAQPKYDNFPAGDVAADKLDVSPGDIAVIYNIPSTATGAGVAVGVVNSSNVNVTYLNNYQETFALTVKNPTVVIDGDDPGETSKEKDALAQLELLSAVAPSASLYLYAGVENALGLNYAFIRAVNDNKVQVLVVDSENCEANLGVNGNQYINYLAEQASAQGMSVIAGAGNGGSDSCQAEYAYGNTAPVAAVSTGLSVNGYASTPFVTAVGATDFYYPVVYPDPSEALLFWNYPNGGAAGYTSAKGYIPEQPLNLSDGATNYYGAATPAQATATGGGISTLGLGTSGYMKPSWQIPVAKGSSDFVVAGTTGRVVPDVAIFAGDELNASSYMLCLQADECVNATPGAITYETLAGTNASSATFGGVAALVVQAHGAQGNINPVLYSLYQSANSASIFHAPAAGTNTVACVPGSADCSASGFLNEFSSGPLAYQASTTYNAAVGLGSVNVANLLTDWATPATTTTNTTLSLTTVGTATPVTSFVHGAPLQTNIKVSGGTGTPAGDVSLITSSPLAQNVGVNLFTLSGGSVTDTTEASVLPGGTYQLYARYAGDGATYLPSLSAPLTLTVTPETSRVKFQTQSFTSGATITYGTSVQVVTFIGSATDGNSLGEPSGSVTVTDQNSTGATGTTIVPVSAAGFATFNSLLTPGTHTLSFAYSGDASYQPSTAATTLSVTVGAQATSTALTSTGSNDPKTGIVQLVATVNSTAGATRGVGPTGTVTFATTGKTIKTLGTATLLASTNSGGNLAGIAYLQLAGSKITAANSTIAATYTPAAGSSYAASTSSPITLTTTATGGTTASTTAIVTSDAHTSYFDYSTLAFNVTIAGTGGTPTGTVTLFANGTALGSTTLSSGTGTVTIANNSSTGLLPAPLTVGKNVITAQYAGDTTFASSAKELTITILDEGSLPDFGLVSNVNSGILSASSSSASFTLQMTSINNFAALGYTLTFTDTLPAGVTCTFGNKTLKFSTTGATLTNTVTCAGAAGYTVASAEPVQKPLNRFWIASGSAAFACVFLLGIPARRKGWQGMLGAILLMVLALGTSAALTACGGNAMSAKEVATAATEGTSNAKAAAAKTLAKGNYQVLVTVSSPFATGLDTTTTATTQVHTIPLTISVQ